VSADFEALKEMLRSRTPEERRQLLAVLQEELPKLPLEEEFGIDAKTICSAISRASDLTKRGVRGVIAEAVFIEHYLPDILAESGWTVVADYVSTDLPVDVVVEKDGRQVRIQVKNQRMELGKPKETRGQWAVEVQKTRTGKKKGKDTRPYSFKDFDLLAVCRWPSCRDWQSFVFIRAIDLLPRPKKRSLIKVMQPFPKDLTGQEVWSDNLVNSLGLVGQPRLRKTVRKKRKKKKKK